MFDFFIVLLGIRYYVYNLFICFLALKNNFLNKIQKFQFRYLSRAAWCQVVASFFTRKYRSICFQVKISLTQHCQYIIFFVIIFISHYFIWKFDEIFNILVMMVGTIAETKCIFLNILLQYKNHMISSASTNLLF